MTLDIWKLISNVSSNIGGFFTNLFKKKEKYEGNIGYEQTEPTEEEKTSSGYEATPELSPTAEQEQREIQEIENLDYTKLQDVERVVNEATIDPNLPVKYKKLIRKLFELAYGKEIKETLDITPEKLLRYLYENSVELERFVERSKQKIIDSIEEKTGERPYKVEMGDIDMTIIYEETIRYSTDENSIYVSFFASTRFKVQATEESNERIIKIKEELHETIPKMDYMRFYNVLAR